ncbi:MAG: NAD-dependent deacylase [Acidobacteria bacterium]|nr:NAD-dependent deacylase [Acidobacteriota bacterium]
MCLDSISTLNQPTSPDGNDLSRAREWLAAAERVAVLTGAGISAESGLPTFRGPNGLWRNHRPETLATPQAFHRDPKLVWEWYDWRRTVHAKCEPNAGHHALAELEARKSAFTLITQNVDSLHERAGSRRVVHLHGRLWRVRCLNCGKEEENREVPLKQIPPLCDCSGMLRPDVVWFGESLPKSALEESIDAARHAEIFLVVGTSSVVYPAAALPKYALDKGACVIEINPEPTALSEVATVSFRGNAGDVLPRIIGSELSA